MAIRLRNESQGQTVISRMTAPKTPYLAVDCALFDREGRVLLVKRKNPPFEGHLALPGGFVNVGEDVETACRRELREEAGIEAPELRLLGIYSEPGRDPRGHICTVVFVGVTDTRDVAAGDDATDVVWADDWRQRNLAFDHRDILADAERFLTDADAR